MNYWHLALLITIPLLGAALFYGVLRAVIYGAFRWKAMGELLQKIGYPGPAEMLSRALMSLFWTMIGVIGLMLIGLIFQMLKLG